MISDSHALGDRLLELTAATLTSLVTTHFPEWRIPGTFGGHRVDADVRADLLYTLTHLAAGGVTEVAGTPVDDAIASQLARVDGRSTHTFFSYRVAETLLRAGPFAGNPLLRGCDDDQRAQVVRAVDSRDWIELLDADVLPRNYAAVLSRCEQARHELGLVDDTAVLDGLVDRLRALLTENPKGYLDDSNDRSGRYDIYTADLWLFCEPLAPRIGPGWQDGVRNALALVDTVAGPDGAAIPWGRSTGVLAAALTVELAALALRADLRDDGAPALGPPRGRRAARGGAPLRGGRRVRRAPGPRPGWVPRPRPPAPAHARRARQARVGGHRTARRGPRPGRVAHRRVPPDRRARPLRGRPQRRGVGGGEPGPACGRAVRGRDPEPLPPGPPGAGHVRGAGGQRPGGLGAARDQQGSPRHHRRAAHPARVRARLGDGDVGLARRRRSRARRRRLARGRRELHHDLHTRPAHDRRRARPHRDRPGRGDRHAGPRDRPRAARRRVRGRHPARDHPHRRARHPGVVLAVLGARDRPPGRRGPGPTRAHRGLA